MVVWERRSSAKVQIFFPRVNSLKEHLNQVLTLKYETRDRRQNTNLLNSTRIRYINIYVEICLSKKCCLCTLFSDKEHGHEEGADQEPAAGQGRHLRYPHLPRTHHHLAAGLLTQGTVTARDKHKIVDVDAKIDKLWCLEHGQQRARADGGHGDGLLLLPLLPRAGAVRLPLRQAQLPHCHRHQVRTRTTS